MNIKYQRLDYPAHCLNVKYFDSFPNKESNGGDVSDLRVLIVTNKLVTPLHFDPAVNLCISLLEQSHLNVDILSVEDVSTCSYQWSKIKSERQILSSELMVLPRQVEVLKGPIADELEDSYHFDNWLREAEKAYDIVISLDALKLLYYPMLTKKLSIDHLSIRFIVFAKSSGYFDFVKSSLPVIRPSVLNRFYVEQQVIELADCFISNSQHYLNWMVENEVSISTTPFYNEVPYVFLETALNVSYEAGKEVIAWVFVFGEYCETEIVLCLQAIKRLGNNSLPCKFIVPQSTRKKEIKNYRSLAHDSDIEFIQSDCEKFDWNEQSLIDSLIVIPNKERINSVVMSLIYGSFRFLTNEFDNKTNQIRSFVHNPEVIKFYLLQTMSEKSQLFMTDTSFGNNWLKQISSMISQPKPLSNKSPDNVPHLKITVCIAHYNRGDMLLRAVDSIAKQSYPCHEVIIVDDGSDDSNSLRVLSSLQQCESKLNIKIKRQNNLFVGASRNAGIAAATGDYILFMDDDNEAMSNELEVFASVVNATGADVLTCLSQVFLGATLENSKLSTPHALFVGPNLSSGLVSNPFGDSNMFAKLVSIKKIGGFSECYKVGRDDHEFLARACLNGLKVELVPKTLYNYRLSVNRIRKGHINSYSGFSRVMQSYSQCVDVPRAQQLRYAQGVAYATGPWGVNYRYVELKLRLIEFARVYVAKFPRLYRIALRLRHRK